MGCIGVCWLGALAGALCSAMGGGSQDLGYADDFVLLADSPEGLQELVDVTADFCAATGRQISSDKTKVLVFSLL